MFNVSEFVHNLTVMSDDFCLNETKKEFEISESVCDDAWLARAKHFGIAGAMDRHIQYLGDTLLPQAENKLNRIEGTGILSEGDVTVSWHSNEDRVHVNDEIPIDQRVDEQKAFIDQLKSRMRTAAIIYVIAVRAHDELSVTLEQKTYGAIKATAASNREARQQTTATG